MWILLILTCRLKIVGNRSVLTQDSTGMQQSRQRQKNWCMSWARLSVSDTSRVCLPTRSAYEHVIRMIIKYNILSMIQCVDDNHTYVQFENCGEPLSSHPIQHWHATLWTPQKKKRYESSTIRCLRPLTGMYHNSVCIRACHKDDCKKQQKTISNATT